MKTHMTCVHNLFGHEYKAITEINYLTIIKFIHWSNIYTVNYYVYPCN